MFEATLKSGRSLFAPKFKYCQVFGRSLFTLYKGGLQTGIVYPLVATYALYTVVLNFLRVSSYHLFHYIFDLGGGIHTYYGQCWFAFHFSLSFQKIFIPLSYGMLDGLMPLLRAFFLMLTK